jgi:hypothetical protein
MKQAIQQLSLHDTAAHIASGSFRAPHSLFSLALLLR